MFTFVTSERWRAFEYKIGGRLKQSAETFQRLVQTIEHLILYNNLNKRLAFRIFRIFQKWHNYFFRTFCVNYDRSEKRYFAAKNMSNSTC
jgi:hypothetical protein